ncbi:MAG: SAM-dependent methyltransferase, partial [Opitutaceae bacterium]|nr:SAM-dependent methyltransferase [Opitutaceae bacterium]
MEGTLVKLTLGKPLPGGLEPGLKNVYVRPVTLKSGPHFSFVYRFATRDVTKNFSPSDALEIARTLLGTAFSDAHLFTPLQSAQVEIDTDGTARLRQKFAAQAPTSRSETHDREKRRPVPPKSQWLHRLGVTNAEGRPREGMSAKLRQIQKFAEILDALLMEAGLLRDTESGSARENAGPFTLVDMGSGKGYLTFAAASMLGARARVIGVEGRQELVELCNDVAREEGLNSLDFVQGNIATTTWAENSRCEVLNALHDCDTATDDALARGIAANAELLVVSPCCQKELRPVMQPPDILS